MILTGKIFDIVQDGEKSAKIILRKKDRDKIVFVAVTVFGYWRDKAINEMKLRPKDKIKGNLHIKSNEWKGKWYTDISFREIYLVEAAPVKMNGNLFEQPAADVATNEDDGLMVEVEGNLVDSDTGEVKSNEHE